MRKVKGLRVYEFLIPHDRLRIWQELFDGDIEAPLADAHIRSSVLGSTVWKIGGRSLLSFLQHRVCFLSWGILGQPG